jgi:hypothetical protein
MLFRSTAVLGALVLNLVLALAPAAQAQELAGNFDQLRVLIKPGETIRVQDSTGQYVKGRFLDLSPDAIRILVDGATRELNAGDVDVVTASRHGDVGKGARIGFATGAGFGALIGTLLVTNGCGSQCIPFFVLGTLTYGGMGAGIGAGLSAMSTSQHVIFARAGAQPRITIAPLVDRQHAGATLNVRW